MKSSSDTNLRCLSLYCLGGIYLRRTRFSGRAAQSWGLEIWNRLHDFFACVSISIHNKHTFIDLPLLGRHVQRRSWIYDEFKLLLTLLMLLVLLRLRCRIKLLKNIIRSLFSTSPTASAANTQCCLRVTSVHSSGGRPTRSKRGRLDAATWMYLHYCKLLLSTENQSTGARCYPVPCYAGSVSSGPEVTSRGTRWSYGCQSLFIKHFSTDADVNIARQATCLIGMVRCTELLRAQLSVASCVHKSAVVRCAESTR